MVRRTSIEIDDELLREAAEVLGTTGLRETVHAALREAIRAQRRRELAEWLAAGAPGSDLHDPAVVAAAGRWRTD